jgi:putative transferase (TIGR04331 family)
VKRFLITTADERTWRRDHPILFLGEWCRLYDRRTAWEHLDAEVVPYHWDDRQRYNDDWHYLQSAYEALLCRTSTALNEHHGTNHSKRYWRILIGPWLYIFTHVLFDRWKMVQNASNAYEIDGTLICDFPLATTIAPDLSAAARPENVAWNEYLFGRVIEYQNKIPWERIPARPESPARPRSYARRSLRKSVLRALRASTASLLAMFTRSNEAMIIGSYLPRLEEIKLQLTLGQVPKLWKTQRVEALPPDLPRRRQLRIASGSPDAFFRFASLMVPEQIPTVYLEGYRNLTRAAQRLPWPSRPKVIFTSNLNLFDEVFKEWAAAKTEAGYPLVIGQHGGFYGTGKWIPGEDHQIETSDRFLTWGWQDDRPQTYPAAILTNINKPLATWNPVGHLLLVTNPIWLLPLRSMSWPVGPNQSARFVNEQIRFAGALDEPIRASLTVRIDRGYDEVSRSFYIERWQDALPGVEIDPSTEPIEGPLRNCRLFIYTHNSTGFLETLGRNIPTVIFWNPWYFELRPDAQPYFDLLARARIYHETPESAAQHVTQIWHDVAEWWNQTAVQQARRTFCEQYARMPKNPLGVLKKALLTVPVGSG